MNGSKYIRDGRGSALILGDSAAVSAFREKRTTAQELQRLKADINTLKTEISELRTTLETLHTSK